MSKERQVRRDRRKAAEKRFQWYGRAALFVSFFALVVLLANIFSSGWTAFWKTTLVTEVYFDPAILEVSLESSVKDLEQANYYGLLKETLYNLFPEVTDRREKRELGQLLSSGAEMELRNALTKNPDLLGKRATLSLTSSSDIDQMHKGNARRDLEESRRQLSDKQLSWYDELVRTKRVELGWNWRFLTAGDSRDAELAGVGGAIMGSLFTLAVCLLLSFPVAVATAVYLEEFAPKNRVTDLIEVNINNLAAVPSIIYGLLGLAIILNFFNFPRGTPLVGGMVLALRTLPVIIISCRAALRAVPPSIKDGALALGASPQQAVIHHVLPLALPGTLTGTIIGLGQALGETAPLLMIGMVAFIVDIPQSPFEPAAGLPVQIYLWAESAEQGFREKTSAAIMIILLFLVLMNSAAIYLRSRFERKW